VEQSFQQFNAGFIASAQILSENLELWVV